MITALLTVGGFQVLSASELFELRKKVKLRFIVASDAHYGQADTAFEIMADTFIEKANLFHITQKCDFCILNGDIIHDEARFIPLAKKKFDELEMPLYVTKGNHDRTTDINWQKIWKVPVNHRFTKGKNTMILATTTNEKGGYLSPNLSWMKEQLEESKKQKNIFIFAHIPQSRWTPNAIDTPDFVNLLSQYPNVKAVFYGHEHKHDNIINHEGVPYIFDSHIGGSWGTDYKGFRVVEVLKDNTIVTYMMNPTEALEKNTL